MATPFQGDRLYKPQAEIVADMIVAMQRLVSDVYVGEDGNLRILFEIEAGQIEGLFLANQIVLNDIFIQTASVNSLMRHGDQWGVEMKGGEKADGTLVVFGTGGTYVPSNSEFSTAISIAEPLYFRTLVDVTIPAPGIPTPPLVALGAAGVLNGVMVYGITFVTAAGETELGVQSQPITPSSQQVSLTTIPIGGLGTISRRVYRSKNGGDFQLVATIANNTATTYTDNTADGSLGGTPPDESTAEGIAVAAESESPGEIYNVVANSIVEVSDAPTGIVGVTNPAPFVNGVDPEDFEDYRQRLLELIRNPETGSKDDLEMWAEAVSGVETATAFPNENMGTAANGHVTVRIAGPNGSVPPAAVITEVQQTLDAKDIANITIHVTTFTPVSTPVTVTITPQTGFTVAELMSSVQQAITDYIEDVPIGGTVYVAGIYDAVFGLPGVATLVVNTPSSNQTATSLQKRVPGTITVS
jgi:uncharacterized phage protein gp47/JayE